VRDIGVSYVVSERTIELETGSNYQAVERVVNFKPGKKKSGFRPLERPASHVDVLFAEVEIKP